MVNSHQAYFCALLCIVALAAVLIRPTQGCDLDQTQHGCRIDNGQCTCAFGCKSEFRYATKKECQDALKGRTNDICSRQPCMNGGSCTQVTAMPQYKCRCEGTGYWGNRCQRLCPKPEQAGQDVKFPHECVVI
ncbi:protein crumbs-like [Anopheles ziemanni]|uniref:protein crumbs-like n=1 Tax=Anopheles coustani TaxID=139045 RepID=UPI00265AE897|nr:protein crumbs-like [Anopheles coustani]XP_058178574.1 protein crumbs-like [Anopheles ziemanni]